MLDGTSACAIVRTRFDGRKDEQYLEEIVTAIFAVCLKFSRFFLVYVHDTGVGTAPFGCRMTKSYYSRVGWFVAMTTGVERCSSGCASSRVDVSPPSLPCVLDFLGSSWRTYQCRGQCILIAERQNFTTVESGGSLS